MSESDINHEAFKLAEKELLDRKVTEVKGYILETLEKMEAKKRDKELIEEELRILKLDLEDLRKGNFDKIEERKEKSKVARNISVMINHDPGCGLQSWSSLNYSSVGSNLGGDWKTYTAGTYKLGNGTVFYF